MNKKILILLIAFALLGSCQLAQPMQTAAPTLQVTNAPTDTRLPTLTPRPSSTPLPPTPTTYPTASTIKANAVAFIDGNSLWVVNVDGSGERKLSVLADNSRWLSYRMLQWSPDGKWIGYLSGDGLWIISPDGGIKRKLFDIPAEAWTFMYVWSPDGSKIAYQHITSDKPTKTPTPGPESGIAPYQVGMIDLATEKVSVLSSHEANAGVPFLKWSPNGHNLLFIKDYSLVLLDVATHKIVQVIKRGCGLERGLSWSPNGKWFSYTDNGVGGIAPTWICVNNVTGDLIQRISVDSTSFNPIWDKAGNYLYFLSASIDLHRKPDPLIDEYLMRYDAKTQKTENLFSLRDKQIHDYVQFVSISPDGQTLLLKSKPSKTQYDLIFVDVQLLTTTKITIGIADLKIPVPYSFLLETVWNPDSQKLIFLAGDICSPNACIQHYGSFYTLNIKTGKITIFSGNHIADDWAISPISTAP